MILSVIVVNWKVCELLRDCLQSLQDEMQLPADTWELIVVDNHSADGSVEMIHEVFPYARVEANAKNIGFARANNQGFRISRGRFVLLLNPDTVVCDHAVDRMIRTMEDRPETAVLGPRLVNSDGSFQRWTGGFLPGLLNVGCHFTLLYKVLPRRFLPRPIYLEHDPTHDLDVGWVSGACMLLRRTALKETIFDDRFFMYGEDMELCGRLASAGWKVRYTPRAQIVHHEGRSLHGQSPKIRVSKLYGLRDVFSRHHGWAFLLYYDLIVLTGFVLRFLVYGMGAVLLRGRGFGERAVRSRRFLAEAFRILTRRGGQARG